MSQNLKNQVAENKISRNDLKDSATRKRINKHLSDIDDTISEEDIRNINTDISSPDIVSKLENEKDTDIDEDDKGDKQDELKEGKPMSPWNIIDES